MNQSANLVASLGIALVAVSACGNSEAPGKDAGPEYPAWTKERASAANAIGARRALTPLRSIIHLHSPLSHDACDGQGRDEETGALDEDCLADLRAALCTTRVDFAALTDHDDFLANIDFRDVYLPRDDDQLIFNDDGDPIASRIRCEGGHEVLWTVGSENALMPIMLDKHPGGTIEERKTIYNTNDSVTAELFRDLGGLTFLAHTEDKPLELLRSLGVDGLEIYNLHANIDPGIREEHLGLDGPAAFRAALDFASVDEIGPEPDLAFLAFLEPSNVALEKWDTLLGEGFQITGTAGTDAHQNALPVVFRDGERADSYRRMIGWFSNIVLVPSPVDHDSIQEALDVGRSFVAFELLGSPAGFDMRAIAANEPTLEIGASTTADAGYELEVVVPAVHDLDPRLDAPDIRVSILHVDATGTREVASGTEGIVRTALDSLGAYRVEAHIRPKHLAPYLGDLGPEHSQKELPWIYSNPIYVIDSPRP